MRFNKSLNKKAYNRFLTIEHEFNEIHSNQYDYSESYYTGYKSTISIKCKHHGVFTTTPKKHIEGQGCPICSDIKVNGHISVSKKNLFSHRNLVIEYLIKTYDNFDFNDFYIDDYYNFKCKKHGVIRSKTIKCEKCQAENKERKKVSTLKKLLENRSEKVLTISEDNTLLECEHGVFKYTNKQLYGKVQLCPECSNTSFNKITQEEFIKRALDRVGDVYGIRNTTYVDAKTKIPLVCDKHGDFEILPGNLFKGQGCNKCSHRTSKAEEELLKLIPGAIQSDRSVIYPYELDIVKDNFAIEYNGLMWHSEGYSSYDKFNNKGMQKKHLIKTELVEERGLQLFHIFENEWVNKREIWESIIKSKLGTTERIYARKCDIREVDTLTYNDFCDINHMQGSGIAKIRIGLYYNNELVSIMSFSKSRFNKNYEYELIRFCSKLNTTVVGGASKLLNYFEIQYKPKSIISYANRRWSTGNLYEKLGFDFLRNTPPNYFYFKPNENILYSRNKFQKHKLSKLLNNFDIKLSESENMFSNGYRKIYDSGNKVFVKLYK